MQLTSLWGGGGGGGGGEAGENHNVDINTTVQHTTVAVLCL